MGTGERYGYGSVWVRERVYRCRSECMAAGECVSVQERECVCLLFSIPLPSQTAALSTSPYMTISCPQPLWVILGQPFLLLPALRRECIGTGECVSVRESVYRCRRECMGTGECMCMSIAALEKLLHVLKRFCRLRQATII